MNRGLRRLNHLAINIDRYESIRNTNQSELSEPAFDQYEADFCESSEFEAFIQMVFWIIRKAAF